ncbi:hypothetical protein AB3S75_013884 [Citrus x aurantiifolia]
MDTEELIRRCKGISLNGETRGKVTFRGNLKLKGEKIVAGCLMGKVLQNREVNLEGLRAAMSQVWRTVREVRIEELGENIFMFKFATEADKKRILTGGPWHFNRALMVLIEPTGLGEVTKQSFSHAPFWVQIHNVPIMCMNEETIREFGKEIGKVEEVGTNAEGECIGKYARLRVSVDVTKPLVKILSLEPEDDEKVVEIGDMEKESSEAEQGDGKNKEIFMPVLYEKLPDFCYVCGCVGHQFRECNQYKGQTRDEMAYGPWLKALTNAEKIKLNKGKERWTMDDDNQRRNVQSQPKAQENSGRELQMGNKSSEEDSKGGSTRHQPDSDAGSPKGVEVVFSKVSGKSGQKLVCPAVSEHVAEAWGSAAGIKNANEREFRGGNAPNKNEKEKEKEFQYSQGSQAQIKASPTEPHAESGLGETARTYATQKKIKKRKWKLQARAIERTLVNVERVKNLKRLNGEFNGDSPEAKRQRQSSEFQTESCAPEAKGKGELEIQQTREVEMTITNMEELTAEAGCQPRRQL